MVLNTDRNRSKYFKPKNTAR